MEMQASGRLGILWLQQCHDDQWAMEVAGLYSSGAGTCACHLTFDKSVSRDSWSSGSGAILWIRSFKWYKNCSIWKIPNGGGGFWVLGFAPDRQPHDGQQGLFRIRVPSGHLCQWGHEAAPKGPSRGKKPYWDFSAHCHLLGQVLRKRTFQKFFLDRLLFGNLERRGVVKFGFPRKHKTSTFP